MKMGLGFYPSTFTENTLSFAKQIGVSHIMIHIPDEKMLPSAKEGYWSYEDLKALREQVEAHGLKLEAIENFQPSHWHHVLLGGPRREEQLENVKKIIRNMGKAGIPIMGYNFSIAAVAGRKMLPMARGNAVTPVFDLANVPDFDKPLPAGHAWGQQIDDPQGKVQDPVSLEEMWERYDWFMDAILHVAQEAGVKMAIHPDDPPVPEMRKVNRLMVNIDRYDRSFARHPSKNNMVEFCQGTFTEMPYGPEYVYEAIDHFTSLDKIAYVHFRNVRGQLPTYYEEFIDTGDVDMLRALTIYKKNGFNGMVIPDHTPSMTVGEPWTTGVAYAIGYMRALCRALDIQLEV